MTGSSFRDRIRKHGYLIAHQGARFNFQENSLSVLFEKKIETAPPDLNLRFDDSGPFQARDFSPLDKVACHIIGPMGVEHDGQVFSFHGDDGIEGLPLPVLSSFNQVNRAPREQKFLKPAGVRKKGGDSLVSQLASNEEAIGPANKFCLKDVTKETHRLPSFKMGMGHPSSVPPGRTTEDR